MDHTNKRRIGWILAVLFGASILVSCAGASRKCNGKKAIMTPMGPM